MTNFYSFHGTVTMISDFNPGFAPESAGCHQLFTLENELGSIVNFVVSPSTYFMDHEIIHVGDRVTGYYNGDLPVILIYPPQYQALVMVRDHPDQNITVDHFDNELLSSDGDLKLNLSSYTQMLLTNGQLFSRYPGGRDLIVQYGPTTRSIPAQTTPYRIIVLCLE
ncbi:hypothetical protein C772_02631 [Bhargavaea cecembensis DSE10]|uniref:Uncharacterized protein n=1 Tax=Bhargavaea cecembensis DSE10 TaxID=1235279 RepID=M7N9Y4_9BACL|nr:hypothetical protein [Bhargavaea cecembensis]EMR05398.1 hypothetical protein C772_02631 [Bhargavaea cecembensis DSE10]